MIKFLIGVILLFPALLKSQPAISANPSATQTDSSEVSRPVTDLPLRLTSFNGRETGNKFEIQWQVQNEDSTIIYIIEKRIRPAGDFAEVKRLTATGADTAKMYSVKLPLSAGLSHYRLKIVPLQGEAKYSEILTSNSINRQALRAFITGTNLLLKLPPTTTSVELVDAAGNSLRKQETDISANQINISLTDVAKGILTIRALCDDEWQVTRVLY